MGEEDEFKKIMKKAGETLNEAMREGQEKVRIVELSGEEITAMLDASDQDIERLMQEHEIDFSEHYVAIKTPRGTSEGYMKSPAELKAWLKRTSLN
jgi:hypothetical protein